MAGQSIGDRITAAQHTIIGSDMSKSVCKATTHEIMGPKKKHLDYLNALTREQNINIPELADLLIERTKIGKWVVVFKSLITTHHLMCYGNERFIQHLASRHALFNLANFIDKTGVQGYDMSTFVRRYAKYLNQKGISYRTVAYDFTRVKRGKDNGVLRTLPTEKLLKTLPTLQLQLDTLLEFQASANELTNGVVNSAFMLLFKDLIRLFACYNDGIINLLEKYFDMKKHHCKEALDLYKKFLTRMEKVSEFLKVAEQVGIDKGDIPDLTQAPNSLLDALEQHYATLEGKKGTGPSKPSNATSAQVRAFSAVSSSFDEKDKEASLLEEEEQLKMFRQRVQEKQEQPTQPTTNGTVAPPAAAQQPTTSSFSIDLLSTDTVAPAATTSNSLFDLDGFSAPQAQTQTAAFPQQNAFGQMNASQPFGMPAQSQPAFSQPAMASNQMFPGMSNPQQPSMTSSQPNLFPTTNAATPFDSNNTMPFQGDLLTPTVFGQQSTVPTTLNSTPNSHQLQQPVGSDLDSSLANVVANLNVGGSKANQNFQPKSEKKLTGGMNYQPQLTNTTTMPPTMQMPGATPGMMPQMPMHMPVYNQQMMGMQPMMQPNMYGQQMGMQQQMNMRQLNPNNPFGPMINF